MRIIPFNFAQKGVIKSGLYVRNLIEAVIIGAIIGIPTYFCPFSPRMKIYLLIFLFAPAVIFSIIGIKGLSLCTFAKMFFRYRSSTKVYTYPTSSDRVRRNKEMARKKHEMIAKQKKQQKLDNKLEKKARKAEQHAKKRTRN